MSTKELMTTFDVVETHLDNAIKYSKHKLDLEELKKYRDDLVSATTMLKSVDIFKCDAHDKERLDTLVDVLARESNIYHGIAKKVVDESLAPLVDTTSDEPDTHPVQRRS